MNDIFGGRQNRKLILSIDGGGMRGIIPLKMLAYLEARTGKPAYELFDMVVGTSTGAIITAGLALRMTAQEILQVVYRDALPKAFGDTGWGSWWRFIRSGLRYRYDLKPFFSMLSDYAGKTRVRDIQHMIFMVTTKDVRTGNTYYVINKGPGAEAFGDWLLAGAVAASTAAPVYFPPVAGNFIDGGVGVQGNPCMAAAIEAMEYLGADYGFAAHHVILISLGTGYVPHDRKDGEAGRYWLGDWIPYIIDNSMNESALQQTLSTRMVYGRRIDFRRYNPYLHSSGLEALGVKANVDPLKLGLDSTRPAELDMMEAIAQAYAEKIDWTLSSQMPWDTIGGHPRPRINPIVDWSKLPS